MSTKSFLTTAEIAKSVETMIARNDWFGIQDEFFADDVESIEPPGSPWLKTVKGKATVRAKGEEWVSKVQSLHRAFTSTPIVAGEYFAIAREVDLTTQDHGRVTINELIVYHVRNGKIISEQFFY